MRKTIMLTLIFMFCFLEQSFTQSYDFTETFNKVHSELSSKYAFSEWKGIKWNSLYDKFQPKIENAKVTNDSAAFYLAMREYFYSIPDGHLRIQGWMDIRDKIRDQQIGGSFGFSLIKLDNGKIVTKLVTENSPAANAGIEFGAEIIKINQIDITKALDSTSIVWEEHIPATLEGKLLNQMRFIGRAPVGNTMEIEFKNIGSSTTETVTLTAVPDDYKTLMLTDLSPSSRDTSISYEILPSGYGYIKLTTCGNDDNFLQIYDTFHDAISFFIDNNVPGLVLDLRINEGGQDNLAAAVASFFYSDTTLYEYESDYDNATGDFKIANEQMEHINSKTKALYVNPNYPLGSLFVEPADLHFGNPVVILNSTRQISSGEGIAMALQKLPNCNIVSLYGSHGSFGMVDLECIIKIDTNLIPGTTFPSFFLVYPYGRSLNANKIIQVDSDSSLIGGVIPDIRPPLNESTIEKMFVQGIDYELEYAVDYLNSVVSINDKNIQPTEFSLAQNYPNPFNPTTTINFTISQSSNVKLEVFNSLGEKVSTLLNEHKTAGKYSLRFNGENLASGLYIYKISANNFSDSKKMVLIK